MKGTEKQIKWAQDIKDKVMNDYESFLFNEAKSEFDIFCKDLFKMNREFIEDVFEFINDSSIWISHKDKNGIQFLHWIILFNEKMKEKQKTIFDI